MDINIRAFGGEFARRSATTSIPNPADIAPDPAAPSKSGVLGSAASSRSIPDLTGEDVDETLVGFEREVAPNLTVGRACNTATVKLGNIIEDFLIPSEGEYFIANPGQGHRAPRDVVLRHGAHGRVAEGQAGCTIVSS